MTLFVRAFGIVLNPPYIINIDLLHYVCLFSLFIFIHILLLAPLSSFLIRLYGV